MRATRPAGFVGYGRALAEVIGYDHALAGVTGCGRASAAFTGYDHVSVAVIGSTATRKAVSIVSAAFVAASTRPAAVKESPMFLRVAIILQTLALFAAPITAGLLLSSPGGRTLHSVSAYAVFTVAVLHLIVAILLWRPGGGSPRPILYAAGFLVLVLAQIALGIAGAKILHVPLGVLLFGLSVLQLSQVLAGRRAPEVRHGT